MKIALHTNGEHELLLVEVGKRPPTREWRRIATMKVPRRFTEAEWMAIGKEGKRLADCWNALDGVPDPAALMALVRDMAEMGSFPPHEGKGNALKELLGGTK